MSGSGKTNCHWAVLLRYWLCLQGIILYCNPRLQLQKCICSRLLTKHLLLLINAILVSDIKSFFDLTVICLCLYVYILFLQINICTFWSWMNTSVEFISDFCVSLKVSMKDLLQAGCWYYGGSHEGGQLDMMNTSTGGNMRLLVGKSNGICFHEWFICIALERCSWCHSSIG